MTLLSIANLSIRFGQSHVVRDLSLSVARGEIVAIVGESGSGKSLTALSTLKLLPGNAVVTGEIHFNGTRISTHSDAEMATLRGNRIGMIFQEPMTALNPLHTVDRQIIEPFCVHHCCARDSAEATEKLRTLMEVVGLSHLIPRGKLYPHQLSGGERQRAMIAMAIACDPDLLIADEPTTALDVTLQRQILDLLRNLQRERGMGMVFITHDLLTVRAIADRVVVMREGSVVESGETEAIFTAAKHPYTQMLLAAAPQGTPASIAADAREVLRAENLSVAFPVKSPFLRRTLRVVKAVDNVSLTLRAGETLGIVGESGSGKSSLAYALLRLIKSEGKIVFLGQNLNTLNTRSVRPLRRAMQLVFQDPYGSLNPRMTVGDIIAEGLGVHRSSPHRGEAGRGPSGGTASSHNGLTPTLPLRGREIDHQVDSVMHAVGLTPEMKNRYPHEFSGGQRQRIAIARAMILKPALVVLDEPTSALDMSVQKQVLELLKSLQHSHQIAYLFISHDLRVIRSVAHQTLVLRHGELVESGATETLFTAPQHPYTKALLAAALG